MSFQATTSQTVGPYFHVGLSHLYRHELAGPMARGQRIRILGKVFDGDGVPVPDALIEVWQANTEGRYAHPEDQRHDVPLDDEFTGFGRIPTDAQGSFEFTTIKPGPVPESGGRSQAPHIVVSVFMRGLLKHALTRIYFDGESANATDPVLLRVPAERRTTLLAVAGREAVYHWEIHMQGERETVFFAV
jgi:protocatechuate 3,4-dioxygenase, alpha subunit